MPKSELYWKNLSAKITDPTQTKNKRPDTSDLERDFIMEYFHKDDNIVDIGSGSGLIINKLYDKVSSIVAIEKFEGFSKYIVDSPNVLVINADLKDFRIRRQYDGVLCTGVSQCFSLEEMTPIYTNMFAMLKQGGYFIMRMHCGLKEDVIVDGYSDELNTNYFASYRKLDSEIQTLKDTGFKDIQTFDIFPDTLNVWENTRHFMFVAKK